MFLLTYFSLYTRLHEAYCHSVSWQYKDLSCELVSCKAYVYLPYTQLCPNANNQSYLGQCGNLGQRSVTVSSNIVYCYSFKPQANLFICTQDTVMCYCFKIN